MFILYCAIVKQNNTVTLPCAYFDVSLLLVFSLILSLIKFRLLLKSVTFCYLLEIFIGRVLILVPHLTVGSKRELHHLLQARLQEYLPLIVDIQFLRKVCYHVEFPVANMVVKLLWMGSTRINGVLLCFLQWEPRFDLNVISEHLSHYFVFSVMF